MKIFRIIATIAMIGCFSVFTLTACGTDKTENSSSVVDKTYASVEEYIADPIIKAAFEESLNKNDDDIALEIKAEGNTLIYEYTYLKVHDKDYIKKESFDTATDNMRESMTNLAGSLSAYIQADDICVLVKHLTADGEVVYKAEFKSDEK